MPPIRDAQHKQPDDAEQHAASVVSSHPHNGHLGVYEDADLIVVNKPAGMVVHPAAGNPTGTLVNASGLPVLSDGGVYDNMGLEAIWKRCKTVLVSDASSIAQCSSETRTTGAPRPRTRAC